MKHRKNPRLLLRLIPCLAIYAGDGTARAETPREKLTAVLSAYCVPDMKACTTPHAQAKYDTVKKKCKCPCEDMRYNASNRNCEPCEDGSADEWATKCIEIQCTAGYYRLSGVQMKCTSGYYKLGDDNWSCVPHDMQCLAGYYKTKK
ncbi:MAG: hypothetical protein LBI17_00420 [Rickettsiales bacterium]|nr:hypothetical protein [Rickettsiales bacterium]